MLVRLRTRTICFLNSVGFFAFAIYFRRFAPLYCQGLIPVAPETPPHPLYARSTGGGHHAGGGDSQRETKNPPRFLGRAQNCMLTFC
jgi:hypothetical protein